MARVRHGSISVSRQPIEISTSSSTLKKIIHVGTYKSYRISRLKVTNTTNNKIILTVKAGTNVVYETSITPSKSADKAFDTSSFYQGQEIYVTIAKDQEKTEYVLTFTYSLFSDAYADINAKDVIDGNKNTCAVIKDSEKDYTDRHVKRLELHAVAGVGYAAKFRVYYKEPNSSTWNYRTSKSFPLGQHKYWDCKTELNLKPKSEVYAAVCSLNILGNIKKTVKSSDIWIYYPESTVIRKYKCTGTVGNPKISKK